MKLESPAPASASPKAPAEKKPRTRKPKAPASASPKAPAEKKPRTRKPKAPASSPASPKVPAPAPTPAPAHDEDDFKFPTWDELSHKDKARVVARVKYVIDGMEVGKAHKTETHPAKWAELDAEVKRLRLELRPDAIRHIFTPKHMREVHYKAGPGRPPLPAHMRAKPKPGKTRRQTKKTGTHFKRVIWENVMEAHDKYLKKATADMKAKIEDEVIDDLEVEDFDSEIETRLVKWLAVEGEKIRDFFLSLYEEATCVV